MGDRSLILGDRPLRSSTVDSAPPGIAPCPIDCYARSKRVKELKMVLPTPAPQSLTLHVMVERTEAGQSVASVLELPGYRVEAATEEQAIAELQQLVVSCFTKAKIVPLELSLEQPHHPNPWTEFIGMFEGDIEFATLAAELRAERGLNMDDPE